MDYAVDLPEQVAELLRDFGTGGMDFAANGGKRQGIVVIMDAELCRSPTAHREAETAKAHRG